MNNTEDKGVTPYGRCMVRSSISEGEVQQVIWLYLNGT